MRTIISDVAVVGGGPGGLAAAHAITAAAPHLKVTRGVTCDHGSTAEAATTCTIEECNARMTIHPLLVQSQLSVTFTVAASLAVPQYSTSTSEDDRCFEQ